MLPAYSYTPLSSDHIRVLELSPGDFDDDVLVHLSTTRLGSGEIQSYEALSYVWGDEASPQRIVIASGPQEEPFEQLSYLDVTRNLFEALRYLRRPDCARKLWIDAVCINQKNTRERNEQVRRMRLIYTTAAHVLVWLGPAAEDSDGAIETLRSWAEAATVDESTRTVIVKEEYTPTMAWLADRSSKLDPASRVFTSCQALFDRPWFERLWVKQEVHQLLTQTTFYCGRESITGDQLQACVRMLFLHDSHSSNADWWDGTFIKLQDVLSPELGGRLDDLLELGGNGKCSDPRDKVYGVLGMLADDEVASAVKIDYAMCVEDLYSMVVRVCIERYRDLAILRFCRPDTPKLLLPTWVPDWTMTTVGRHRDLPEQYADVVISLESPKISAGVLELEGVQATQIIAVTAVLSRSIERYNYSFDEIRSLFAFLSSRLPHASHASLVEWMATTIGTGEVADHVTGVFSAVADRTMYPQLSTLASTLKQIVTLSKEEHRTFMYDDSAYYHSVRLLILRARAAYYGRSIVVTETGQCAVAPRNARSGDVLCSLLGSRMIMALRPLGDETYRIVGPCFAHGLNWGETLLGQIPPNWCYKKWFYSEISDEWRHAFLNEQTGVLTTTDPRVNWEKLRISEDHPQSGSTLALDAKHLHGFPVRPPDKQYLIDHHGITFERFRLV